MPVVFLRANLRCFDSPNFKNFAPRAVLGGGINYIPKVFVRANLRCFEGLIFRNVRLWWY